MNLRISLWFGYCLFFIGACHSQRATINWLDFEQLEDSLAIRPKKVFIDFYADWCAYCKKMDRAAFRDEGVVAQLNSNYYAVKMNVESKDTIAFGGDTFYNRELGKKRNPTHEIPLLLASREGSPFSLPAIVILNEEFQMSERYFEYIPPKAMLEILTD